MFARLCAWTYNTTQTAVWAWCPRGHVCKEMDSMCVFLCVARERTVCVSLCGVLLCFIVGAGLVVLACWLAVVRAPFSPCTREGGSVGGGCVVHKKMWVAQ